MLDKLASIKQFVSNADYTLPFEAMTYITKHFYIWSYQAGALNFDGIIRLPGRLVIILGFLICGNIFASYMYLAVSFIIVAASFWVFLRYFLESRSLFLNAALTFVYTLSPAFLGNTAKIGLVAAAGLLPLCLVLIKYFFKTKSFTYLFLLLLCINYSLLHPYTFTMNVVFCAGYTAYSLYLYRADWKPLVKKLTIGTGIALLLNMYIIAPVLSIGSIDKSIIMQDISTEPVDYSGLIEVSNAGDPITAFSLAKHVFLDFKYYVDSTYIVYSAATLGLYVIAFGLFYRYKDTLSKREHRIFLVSTAIVLVMLFMTSGHDIASRVFTFLVDMPGGWIFRSPLKWQLYVPLFLMTIIAMLALHAGSRGRRALAIGLLVLGLLQSSVLAIEIYNRLLVPKHVATFKQLDAIPEHTRVLYIGGRECLKYTNQHPDTLTEFNQVLTSKNIQVKRSLQSNLGIINLNDFDYIVTCKEDGNGISAADGAYTLTASMDSGVYKLYKNTTKPRDASIVTTLFHDEGTEKVNDTAVFVRDNVSTNFNFTNNTALPSVYQVFGTMTTASIEASNIHVSRTQPHTTPGYLYANKGAGYYRVEGDSIYLSEQSRPGFTAFSARTPVPLSTAKNRQFHYVGNTATNANVVTNGEFHRTLWKKDVDDCYDYDDNPNIHMRRVNDIHGDALSLSSSRHIACTSQGEIPVKSGESLLLSYDYRTVTSRAAGFSITYNDPGHTTHRYNQKPGDTAWHTYNRLLNVPDGASTASLTLYGYPLTNDPLSAVETRYDNVSIINLPRELVDIYLVTGDLPTYDDATVSTTIHDPTKRTIRIEKARNTVILKIYESFHPQWHLRTPHGKAVAGITHTPLNTFTEGWKIDVATLCGQPDAPCTKQPDGSYTIQLMHEFTPQKFLIIGYAVSCLTFVGCVLFITWKGYRHVALRHRNKK